jgi:hypothetical protein
MEQILEKQSGVPMSSAEFVNEATRISEAGKEKDITLRVMGACAIRIHCPNSRNILDSLNRTITDIDFMSYGKFEAKISNLFKELGYRSESEAAKFYAHMYGQIRSGFIDPKTQRKVDVFYDKLEMCHTIDFKNRLETDFPTLTVSDLLLEKMQIVKINEKDIKDTLVLILEHDVGGDDRETTNMKYISKLLSEDWGFYYTVTTNLNKIKTFLSQYDAFTGDQKTTIEQKIDKLVDAIERQPKSMKWRMRAKIGTSRKWYVDVEEISRGDLRLEEAKR